MIIDTGQLASFSKSRYSMTTYPSFFLAINSFSLSLLHHTPHRRTPPPAKYKMKCFTFSFFGWGPKVTYDLDIFEKLRPP